MRLIFVLIIIFLLAQLVLAQYQFVPHTYNLSRYGSMQYAPPYPYGYSPWRGNFLAIDQTLGSVLPSIEYPVQQSPNSYVSLMQKYRVAPYHPMSRTANSSKYGVLG